MFAVESTAHIAHRRERIWLKTGARGGKIVMRKLFLLPLLALSMVLSGCSYATELAVVNLSDQPVVVRYRFKESRPFEPETPRTKSVAELDADVNWGFASERAFAPKSKMTD